MSQTPETDAAEMPVDRVDAVESRPACIVDSDFARKLERERDNERKLNASYRKAIESSNQRLDKLESELELMTIKAAGWQNQATIETRALVECWEKLHKLQVYADKLADGLPEGMLPKDVENLREANAGLASDLQKAERERDEAREELKQWRDAAKGAENSHPDEVHCTCVPLLLGKIATLRKERDEARDLARNLYWAGHDLRRFARAYEGGYDEVDGRKGAILADKAFFDASKNLAKILGEEEAVK